jgi:hypothetical protein
MNLTTTFLFYLLLGGAVAVAMYLMLDGTSGRDRWFRTLTAIIFWPLYLPAILQRSASRGVDCAAGIDRAGGHVADAEPRDELFHTIRRVEAELDLALQSLDGWSDAVLEREQHRFEELRAAWHTQAAKIRELDQLLAQPAFGQLAAGPVLGNSTDDLEATGTSKRIVSSERARRENIARLRAVRGRLHDDLLNTLSWVRELVTMIHLAKYTGAPASRAEELVVQIATSVEGLSEVATWRDEEVMQTLDR